MSSKFGDYLRGARLGYGYVKELDVFVRITGPFTPEKPWLVEVALHATDMKPMNDELHYCWWEGMGDVVLMKACSALQSWLMNPKRYYWVSEEGKEIESG